MWTPIDQNKWYETKSFTAETLQNQTKAMIGDDLTELFEDEWFSLVASGYTLSNMDDIWQNWDNVYTLEMKNIGGMHIRFEIWTEQLFHEHTVMEEDWKVVKFWVITLPVPVVSEWISVQMRDGIAVESDSLEDLFEWDKQPQSFTIKFTGTHDINYWNDTMREIMVDFEQTLAEDFNNEEWASLQWLSSVNGMTMWWSAFQ